MRKVLLFLAAGFLSVVLIGVAGATPITIVDTTLFNPGGTTPAEDYDAHGYGTVNKLDWSLDYVTWTHHFPDAPAPAIGSVISGEITIYLRDDEGDVCWNPFTWDIGVGMAEGWTWAWGDVDTEAYSYNVTASYLDDGEFQVTVGSIWGDFYIDQSDLEVTYNPVPEASTLLLLGSGLPGLALWARTRRRKKTSA